MRKKTVQLDYMGVRVPRPLANRVQSLVKWKTTRSTVLIRCLEMGLPVLEKELEKQAQSEKTEGIAA